jgi:hypothetical protein
MSFVAGALLVIGAVMVLFARRLQGWALRSVGPPTSGLFRYTYAYLASDIALWTIRGVGIPVVALAIAFARGNFES